ncbi:NAD(P)H:quinone oxidoreductase, type IV [Tetragenococcus osmophilus]|uniref:NAD(P)H dehydrogenase (Quinone) n=1 Tax=Tetragenococcus osmophilus TaxID=526944 RepID=A0AA38CWV3_9ENTE|nr:NAD(P)H:quinone oxidoreductase [Tetragenococcus osmophilus]AYW48221.1 NAD(P)H:quinone oxidoreductase, type IV [Tetragenococcus osmophilus]GMA54002.1 NAD(P)H dehydrogenase (quinone) [Alicyclobacillus contaminans]GMA72101.1 NAD(P)H dehydrogenase (quinone) [Tetragenococcus osmophilus]
MTKIAIVYYSSTGTNYQLAQWAKEAVENAGAQARLVKAPELAPDVAIDANPAWRAHYDATRDIPEVTSDDIVWADGIIFSVPSRFGVMAAQLKQFIDTQGGIWASGDTVNKVVSGMTSAHNAHGGQEATLLSLYIQMMHWGAIIAAPGYSEAEYTTAGGNPYGTSVTIDDDGNMIEDVEEAAKQQARHVVDIAGRVNG